MSRVPIFASACVALLCAYHFKNRENLSAEDFRRDQGLGYDVMNLTYGRTAYKLAGPKEGKFVVIVHGGTLGSMAYQAYVAPLVSAGYRVCSYDQFGRGFSDRPKEPLSIDMMRIQLLDLLNYLKVEKAFLYGVSFGGSILARFAAEHPNRVRGLGYQVPVICGVTVSKLIQMVHMPVLGPLIARFIAIPAIISRGESFGTETEEARKIVNHFKGQFAVQGTERMITELFTGDALSDRIADHEVIGCKTNLRAQFVYATDDSEIAAEQIENAISLYKKENIEVHTYLGGHFFSSGYVNELTSKLDKFFQSCD